MRSPVRWAAAMLTFLLVSTATSRPHDELHVSCLPDKVIARPGESIGVTAWVASAAGAVTADVRVRWTVSGGRIDRQSPAARWLLEGASVDRRHTASVEVTVADTPAGSCSLGVWIAAEEPDDVRLRGEYIARRAFLREGDAGEPGFGLYSYFLMRQPSSASERARSESFVGAFLDGVAAVSDQENYVERRRLNGSYLPVTMDPPRGLSAQERGSWAVEHYDYEHAGRLLSLYPMLTGPGPFIIAVPAPLRSPVRPMLPWDLSPLDSRAIAEGVSRFVNQAAQLYDWQNQATLPKLRDEVLTAVAGMFVGRAAAERWMQIVR